MQRPVDKDQIEALECKHVIYCKANDGSNDDLLAIKERIHTYDGRQINHLHFVKNYKRPFWITKPNFRDHKEFKEWEHESRLDKFMTRESELKDRVAKALDRPGFKGSLSMLADSHFVYGADRTSPTLIKQQYRTRFPKARSLNTVAVIDIETDMVYGHERPIYVGVTFKDKAYLATTQEFIGDISNPVEKLHQKFQELLPETIAARDIHLEVEVCENAGQACANAIRKAHEWEPDFLSAWRKDFDIPRIAECLENHGYDLAEVFSDPRVPPRFRFFRYKPGQAQRTKADGTVVTISPAEQWPVTECPATFYVIDSMRVFKQIRITATNEPKYSLDYQLNDKVGQRKLKFDDIVQSTPGTPDWHVEMQQDHKIEYGVYNLFDCIGVELFDEVTQDLALSISIQSNASEYNIFDSQPKRLVNTMFFFCKDLGYIVSAKPRTIEHELDQYVVTRDNWTITLPAHLRIGTGLKIIRELPNVRSEAHIFVSDLDVSAGYPSGQRVLNMSKETTLREMVKIRNKDKFTQRFAGINILSCGVNSHEIAMDLFDAPSYDTLLADFREHLAETATV